MSWFTKESIVFGKKLPKVSEEPGTHVVDEKGNKVVVDGNHRAYRDIKNGKEPKSNKIGDIKGDVSKDPWYRRIWDLKVSDADPPFDD